jgi:hypothetical protein
MQQETTPRRREGFLVDDAEPVEEKKAAQEPAPPPLEEWPLVIKLRRPIDGDKGPITELSLKEPTANHVIRAGGNPFEVEWGDQNADGSWRFRVHTDYRKLMTLIANLSGVMEPFLQKMDPRDLALCGIRLQGFFLP